jgi:hypothetical protein
MATSIQNIPDYECIGTSLQKINDNFSYLDQQITNDTTLINSLSSYTSIIGTTVSLSSNFVYSVYTDGSGNSDNSSYASHAVKMTNTWQDIFTDSTLTPLRISYTNNTPYAYTALLQGKIFARNVFMAATSFYRIARFSSTSNTFKGTPSGLQEVIETAACEGNTTYSHGYNTILQGIVTIPANSTVVYGLQSWFPKSGAQTGGLVNINGWQTAIADSYLINTIPGSYANSLANGSTIGYPNGATYSDPLNSIGVYSYLKLIVL